ncbi:hypothetical protein B0H67DRAFT_202561 [Lasiosphaeris hirsuta]|uniref:Uncharacterized protein n=1 Tax=Lasiosphaeris hirsuta TaxID=260670 RepID=A0AA40ARP6_9PEZI|nr:hypothetical protein B0H67DRAFT_202561 [Lasiosphaeris hirsuta]
MSGANSWLARQRKSDLIELAQTVGLKEYVFALFFCQNSNLNFTVYLVVCIPLLPAARAVYLPLCRWLLDAKLYVKRPVASLMRHTPRRDGIWVVEKNMTANKMLVTPPSYETLRKTDLELQLDEHIADNSTQFQSDPRLVNYFASRARTAGSPVKREAPELKVSKRRATKAAEEIASVDTDEEPTSASTALVRTPGRALSLASRIPLPATPADVASAVDRGTVALRARAASLYQESGITEATAATRESLSTVTSVLFTVAAFELWALRPELLPNRYAFTIPALALLGTAERVVHLPDMFALLTAAFWAPALTWALTSLVLPSLFGYFFNLSAANHQTTSRGRPRAGQAPEYVVDPLTFSIVKALATYVVYAQGVTLGGWIDPAAVARINGALYSGWKGVLVGTAVSGITAVYDAVLKK